MKIAIVASTKRKYGGNAYGKMAAEVLSNGFEIEAINVGIKRSGKLKYFEVLSLSWGIFMASKRKDFDFIIKDFEASLFLNKKPVKNIAIIHHLDHSSTSFFLRLVYPLLQKIIFSNLKKFDAIVTASKYWENYFKKKGYKNVYKIYNGFDLSNFDISDEEASELKKRLNLSGKPIIYLGNCQRAKGVVEVYQALKDLDAHLVTSGSQQVEIPARNLEIEYKDYLKLLKASSVAITMSKFKEGWCRTAHEAMLLKTPVIGSGLGGMEELLEGGKQIICNDFNRLKEKVECLLKNPAEREKIGQDGYNFAKNFTKEKFKKDWLELIQKLYK